MSKKKSNPIKDEMLDSALMGSDEKQSKPKMENGKVSLMEYSKTAPFSFNSENYRILLAGLGVNILGYILMVGGGTDNPANFDKGALFSDVRITLAPALIVIGFAIIAYSVMKRPKAKKEE